MVKTAFLTVCLFITNFSIAARANERACYTIWEQYSDCPQQPSATEAKGSIEISYGVMGYLDMSPPVPGQATWGDIAIKIRTPTGKLIQLQDKFHYATQPGHGTWKDYFAPVGQPNQTHPLDTNLSFDGSDVSSTAMVNNQGQVMYYCTSHARRCP